VFEPEVVVQMAGEMFLDAEEAIGFFCGGFTDRLGRSGRFGCFLEVALLFVLL
jgi:hypothetical protein